MRVFFSYGTPDAVAAHPNRYPGPTTCGDLILTASDPAHMRRPVQI
ncbi:hypothetical protein [Streptomyces sp. 35G-GA-8]|nr:hypothetical protein [Streptomyces sp. 35G-GA-8]MCL7380101.1 hypothetical protein [Streptomyces sp. 35G-GA-8]